MDRVLKGLAAVTVVLAIIAGIIEANKDVEILGHGYDDGFRWIVALSWWASGIVSAILIYAFGVVVEHLQIMSRNLYIIASAHEQPQVAAPKLGNSKADVSKLQGFKL